MTKYITTITGYVCGFLIGAGILLSVAYVFNNKAAALPRVLICYDTMAGAAVTIPSSTAIVFDNGVWKFSTVDGKQMYLQPASSDRCSAVTLDMAAKIAEATKNNNNNAQPQVKQLP